MLTPIRRTRTSEVRGGSTTALQRGLPRLMGAMLVCIAFGAVVSCSADKAPARDQQSETPQVSVPVTGQDVCAEVEKFGNKTPGLTQKCAFEASSGADTKYTVTFTGSYGDDELLYAISLARRVQELDARAHTRVPVLYLSFPDERAAFHGLTKLKMSELRSCFAGGDETDQRLCAVRLVSAGGK